MVERDFVYGGRPSFSRLAAEAQKVTGTTSPTTQTVIDIVLGGTETPTDAIVSALAKALRLPVKTVAGWVGQSRELDEPYDPPDGSDRLTRKQREALDQLIRVMIDSEENDRGNTAPKTGAGATPAVDFVWPRDRIEIGNLVDEGIDVEHISIQLQSGTVTDMLEYLQESGRVGRRSAEHQADYSKAAQSNTPRTRANRQRRAEEKYRIPGEDQGEASDGGV